MVHEAFPAIISEWAVGFLGGEMSAGRIQIPGNDRNTSGTLSFNSLSRTWIAVIQMVGDSLILTMLSYTTLRLVLYEGHYVGPYIGYSLYLFSTIFVTTTFVYSLISSGLYRVFDKLTPVNMLISTIIHLFKVILLLTAGLYFLKVSDELSRLWLATWSVTSAVALCGFRLLTASAVERLIRTGRLTKNVAIIGATEIGQQLAAKFIQEFHGLRLVGIFDERRSRFAKSTEGDTTVRHMRELYELLWRGCVDDVVIALPVNASQRILELSRRVRPFAVSLRVVAPDGYEHFEVLDSRVYGDIGTFRIMGKPLDEVAALVKRIEDVVIGLSCLLAMLPFMFLIALAVKLDSPGPVLFRQKRLGANNLPFELLKFRSMYVDQTDPFGRQLTRAGDPRVTRVGRFLRSTSLDELPQLMNVLRGDMSLVGPRPHALAASAAGVAYARAISEYPIRHRVKPGMTGWAQVNGWRGETTTIEQIRRRVDHDLYYIDNWSVTFDFVILMRTVFAVVSRGNAI